MNRLYWALLLCGVLLNIWAQSHSVPRSDDISYLAWAVERTDQPWAPFTELTAFPNWRPAAFLAWWGAVKLDGVSGNMIQVFLGALWLVAWGSWTAWVGKRWGEKAAFWTGLLILCTAPVRDLLTWRSWVTTVGELACAGLALCCLENRSRNAALLLGVIACGFKEPAAFLVGGIAWAIYGERRIALILFFSMVPSSIFLLYWNTNSEIVSTGIDRILAFAKAIATSGWLVLSLLGMKQLPQKWAVVILATLLLPVLYPHSNMAYFSETLLVTASLTGVMIARKNNALGYGVGVLILSMAGWIGSIENIHYQWQRKDFIDGLLRSWTENPPDSFVLTDAAQDESKYLTLQLWWRWHVPVGEQPQGNEVTPGLFVVE